MQVHVYVYEVCKLISKSMHAVVHVSVFLHDKGRLIKVVILMVAMVVYTGLHVRSLTG